MRLEKNIVILLVGVFIFSSVLHAENKFVPGRIITSKKDTLSGLILFQSNIDFALGCIFKVSPNSREQQFGTKDITGFLLVDENRSFTKRQVEYLKGQREVFLEMVLKGKLNLYCWQDRKLGEKVYLTANQDSILIPFPYEQQERYVGDEYTRRRKLITSTYHQDTLKKYLSDRPDLIPEIERMTRPKLSNLTSLLIKYNQLEESKISKLPSKNRAQKIGYNLILGLSTSNFQPVFSDKEDYYGGATFAIDVPNIYDHFALYAGFYNRIIIGNSVARRYLYQYKIPFGLEYRFGSKFIQPFIALGADGFVNRLSTRFIIGPGAGLKVKLAGPLSFSFQYNINIDIYLDAKHLQLANSGFKTLNDSWSLGLQVRI